MHGDRVGAGLRMALLPLMLAGGSGCTPSQVVVQAKLDPSHANLMHIGSAYQRFLTAHSKAPAGIADLKPFLKEFGNAADQLRSPHDGQPYVICWGIDLRVPQSWVQSTGVLAYEQHGVQGKRYVLTTMRSVVPMTDEEFRQANFPPGHRPPP